MRLLNILILLSRMESQATKAGKMFLLIIVEKIAVIAPDTSEIRYAPIFICELGISNFSFVEAT